MLTKETVTQLLAAERATLAERFGVRRIGLFGSFANGIPSETSDVDLVVELDRPLGLRFMDLAEHLEKLLDRRIDLLTPAGLASMRNGRVTMDIVWQVASSELPELEDGIAALCAAQGFDED